MSVLNTMLGWTGPAVERKPDQSESDFYLENLNERSEHPEVCRDRKSKENMTNQKPLVYQCHLLSILNPAWASRLPDKLETP